MASLYDIVRVYTATAGTAAPIVLGAAVPTFRTPAQAGIPDGARLSYAIEDIFGGGRETGWGIYAAGAQTLTRNTTSSSNANNPISLSGQAQIYVSALATDLGWSNTRLAKTASYTVANQDKNSTIALGGAAFFSLTFGAASAYDANFAVVVVNEDSGRGKTIALTGGATFILWPGQSIVVFNQNNAWQTLGRARWRLAGNITMNCDPANGSASNDGLAAGAGGARIDPQDIYAFIASNLDVAGFTVTVSMAAGTYTNALFPASSHEGGGVISFDGGNAATCVWSPSAATMCIGVIIPILGRLQFNNITFANANSYGIFVNAAPTLIWILSGCVFGTCQAYHMLCAAFGAQINCFGYSISGGLTGAVAHMAAANGGFIQFNGNPVVTVTANIAVNIFAYAFDGGQILAPAITFTLGGFTVTTGTARHYAITAGGIETFGAGTTYFPGTTAGFVSSPGWYA
jgi:hypothetical protein